MNLPSGTQIIPHDASRNTATAASGANVTIPKLADTIVVREDADIDRITDQLVRKLRGDEYPEEIIEAALAYVESYGYVDDLRYAGNYIESTGGSRSRRRIAADLMRRGVPSDVIEEAFAGAEEVDEAAQITALLARRGFDPETAEREEREKMIRFLMRKGYSYENISRTIDV